METYVLVYEHFTEGGAETLMIRVSKALIARKKNIIIVCYDMVPELFPLMEQLGVTVIQTKGKTSVSLAAIRNSNENDVIITFLSKNYIDCIVYLQKLKEKRRIFNYLVHTEIFNPNSKHWIRNYVLRKTYPGLVECGIKNGAIFFMNQKTVDVTIERIKLDKRLPYKIIRLPYEIPLIDENRVRKRAVSRQEKFNILTIARSEFPFKGYIKGLILIFAKLKKKYPQITLVIVSSGNDIDNIRYWVKSLNDSSASKDISIIENVPYDELNQYYDDASVYVGMGSTILEAAERGIVDIAVKPYTYEIFGQAYYCDRPQREAADEGSVEMFIHLLENSINMSCDEYIDNCLRTYRAVKSLHSMDNFVDYLTDTNNGNVDLECKVYSLYRVDSKLQDLRNRIKRK